MNIVQLSSTLAALLAAEYGEEIILVNQARPDQTDSGPYDRWTLLDTLAHCAAWKTRSAVRQLDWLAGRNLPAEEDLESTNRSIYDTCKNYSWPALPQILAAAYQQSLQVVSAAGEDRLHLPGPSGPPLWTGLVANCVWHPLYHLSAWLFDQGQRAQALALLEAYDGRLAALPLEPRIHALAAYDWAVLLLKDGARQQAVAKLRTAFGISAKLKEWARQDPDLASLHGDTVLD
jgi:hypothetical protein